MNDDMKYKMIENQKRIERNRDELRRIIYDDKDKKPKKVKKPLFTNILLSIMFCLGLFFSLFLIIDSSKRVDALYEIINAILILLIVFSMVISFPKTMFKHKSGMTGFTSFLIIGTMVFNGLYLFGIIKLPTQSHIIDYSNKSLGSAIEWADKNKIDYDEIFEYSDKVLKYNILNQSVKANTLTKNIKNVEFTVSNGPDYSKTVVLSDMSGLTTDDVLKFVDDNFLKNVKVDFEENKDIKNNEIIRQNITGKVKRSDEVVFVASLGDSEKLSPIKIKKLKGKKLLNSLVYLGKSGIGYELKYEFNNKVKRGYIISCDKNGSTVKPGDKVVLTVSKGKKIKVPEFKNVTLKEVMDFVIKNNLDIEYSDKYDNGVKKGKVISANHKKGDVIEEETVLKFVFSKGKLVMKSFKDLASFKSWAEKYEIKYEIKEEFNKDVPKDSIIKFSVKDGKKIDKDEGVIVYVSKGESVKVPDFIGKNKDDIQKDCDSLGIMCSFYNTLSDKPEGTCLNQSVPKDTEISKGENVDIEISTKKQEEVTVKKKAFNNSSSSGSSGSSTPSSSSSSNSNNSQSAPTPSTPSCNEVTLNITEEFIKSSANETCSKLKGVYGSAITCSYMNSDMGSDGFILNIRSIQGKSASNCNPVNVEIKCSDC